MQEVYFAEPSKSNNNGILAVCNTNYLFIFKMT